MVQVCTAARTQPLAVWRAEILRVHIQEEHVTQQLLQIQLHLPIQQNDIIIFLVFQFGSQHGLKVHRLLLGKGLGAAVANEGQGGCHAGLEQQHPRHIPHSAFHSDRLGYRVVSVPLQLS